MTLAIFDQFSSPVLLGTPLAWLAIITPSLIMINQSPKFIKSRYNTLLTPLLTTITKQLFLPMNPQGHKWALICITVMMFILLINLLGLIPYTFTPTTQLSMNMGLAIPLWLATVILGMQKKPTESLAHLLPEGTPIALIPMLIIIETISLFIRPIALGVRLTANLTAGHLLLQLISTATVAMAQYFSIAMITFILLLLLSILELAVAMIQAYVFILLLTLYLQENVYVTPSPRMPHS
uniref:ATP synthase F0 subunit 6 n=1 Tax=Mordacia mordax TaxID=7755 RepID=UPI0022DCE275|nr:ATP synthase F0 subunit 6 [Mordacia mordax]YP_010587552.1 ATP synthase F0 subunit 6 [Mordacia praecox]WAB46096.1 ATP synthase F0 subunit 6 [Mordacia mordax]WAB46109.1 ATP synthase F0 subunit 6 [Mordacia praecox]